MKLYDMNYQQLEEYIEEKGFPRYRADQVFTWLYKGVPIEEMNNIPKDLKAVMQQTGLGGVHIMQSLASEDGSQKLLYQLEDDNIIEGVLMQYHHGSSLCVSTQVGCAMGCGFCESTKDGIVRNLSIGEMTSQLYSVAYQLQPPTHCVLMGSGEPLDNYKNVIGFIRNIIDEKGYNMSARNISISTCGLVEEMYLLAGENLPITLSVSLHAPNDAIRREIMPIAKRYKIQEVVDAAKQYEEKTRRRVTFEYAMIDGVNDSECNARELIALTKNIRKHINLIPLNQNSGDFTASSQENIQKFYTILKNNKVSVSIRRTLGADIGGACGQLRASTLKNNKG